MQGREPEESVTVGDVRRLVAAIQGFERWQKILGTLLGGITLTAIIGGATLLFDQQISQASMTEKIVALTARINDLSQRITDATQLRYTAAEAVKDWQAQENVNAAVEQRLTRLQERQREIELILSRQGKQ